MGMAIGWRTVLAALCLMAAPVMAGSRVELRGLMGDRALVAVAGGPARMLRAGDRYGDLRLVEIKADSVVIEQGGRRSVVRLGSQVTVRSDGSGNGPGDGGAVTLNADAKGHFMTVGLVNGSPVNFLVDTGASAVALPRSVAEQAGVRLDSGQRAMIHTANGKAPAWRVILNSVQVGGIRLHMVEAVVVDDGQLPVNLLGMSFLNRTDMRRAGDVMTLVQRY